MAMSCVRTIEVQYQTQAEILSINTKNMINSTPTFILFKRNQPYQSITIKLMINQK